MKAAACDEPRHLQEIFVAPKGRQADVTQESLIIASHHQQERDVRGHRPQFSDQSCEVLMIFSATQNQEFLELIQYNQKAALGLFG